MGTNSSREHDPLDETGRDSLSSSPVKHRNIRKDQRTLKPSPWLNPEIAKQEAKLTNKQIDTSHPLSSRTNNDGVSHDNDNNDDIFKDIPKVDDSRAFNNNNQNINSRHLGSGVNENVQSERLAGPDQNSISTNNNDYYGQTRQHVDNHRQNDGVFSPRNDNRPPLETSGQRMETYAERHAREKRRAVDNDQLRLVRQKTIYRNEDEWQEEEEEEKPTGFDVNKFKEANKANISSVSGLGTNTVVKKEDNYDTYFPESNITSLQKGHVPNYDDTDEDLIASIEREYT